MHRLLLIWDGNQTTGDLETALAAAAAQRVPIDVMPLKYNVTSEVLVDRFIAPTWKRENEPFTIENEQLTPSLKIRRHVIGKVYGERLAALYRK